MSSQKSTKWHVHPAQTQISLGIAQSDQFLLSTRRNLSSLTTHWVHSEDWSDGANTHVDLILPWEPSHFLGFVMRWLSYGKNRWNQQADYLRTYWLSGSVTRASGCIREVMGSFPGRVIPKALKICISWSFVCVQHWESGTGRSGVSLLWLGGMSRHVPEVWYVSEAALFKWALSSLPHSDTVAIWLKDCWKRRSVWIKIIKKKYLGTFFFQVEICPMNKKLMSYPRLRGSFSSEVKEKSIEDVLSDSR